MKYILLWDVDKYDFLLKNILAVALKPKRRAINHTSRPLNSFTLFTQGEVEYTFDGETHRLPAGSLIYLPKGSRHSFRWVSDKVLFSHINFEMYVGGEYTVFSKTPLIISTNCDPELQKLFSDICNLYSSREYCYTLRAKARLIEFIYTLLKINRAKLSSIPHKNPATACIEYINENYSQKITTEELCRITSLSPTHLRRVFKNSTGSTIVDYVNQCRITKSLELLAHSEMSVMEISEAVGFESQNYYTRVFRKLLNTTPNAYRNNLI